MDGIETIKLKNVLVQANGIIRNSEGRLIARLVKDVDFDGEHVKGLGGWDLSDKDDLLEFAWGIIANANGGDWDSASDEWREAAEKWRDGYFVLNPKVGLTKKL